MEGTGEEFDEDSDEEESKAKMKEQFEHIFAKVDTDKSGTIDRSEMLIFIKELIGV